MKRSIDLVAPDVLETSSRELQSRALPYKLKSQATGFPVCKTSVSDGDGPVNLVSDKDRDVENPSADLIIVLYFITI
jgi:hypothetical protein